MIIYYPLKRYNDVYNEFEYIPTEYDLLGTFYSFSNKIDFIKFISKSYISKNRCIKFCNTYNKHLKF